MCHLNIFFVVVFLIFLSSPFYFQNMSDVSGSIAQTTDSLDVNVKFTGVRVFEYTPECIVFDLLDIPLYHGWLVDQAQS